MPIIRNLEKNLFLEINLIINNSLDLKMDRADFMNWIPFEFRLDFDKEVISFSKEVVTVFSVKELKYLIENLYRIVQIKSNKNLIESSFEYVNSENLFEMILYETGEENQVYCDLWFNLGSLTNGKIFGFSKGIRFVSDIGYLDNFTMELEKQMLNIINNSSNFKKI